MNWWVAGLAGLGGGAAVELVDLYKLIRTTDGSYELPPGGQHFWLAYLIAVAIRLVLGFAASSALYASEQISTILAAAGVGAGSTGIVEHLSRTNRSPAAEVSQA